jgi:hypothetical protein
MTLCYCRERPAARAIRTHLAKISLASEPIRVPGSSARSAVDATAAAIAAVSVDAADGRMGVPIVPIAPATVDRIAVPIVVLIGVLIGAVIADRTAAVGVSSAAAATGRIVDITAATLLLAGLNSFPKC